VNRVSCRPGQPWGHPGPSRAGAWSPPLAQACGDQAGLGEPTRSTGAASPASPAPGADGGPVSSAGFPAPLREPPARPCPGQLPTPNCCARRLRRQPRQTAFALLRLRTAFTGWTKPPRTDRQAPYTPRARRSHGLGQQAQVRRSRFNSSVSWPQPREQRRNMLPVSSSACSAFILLSLRGAVCIFKIQLANSEYFLCWYLARRQCILAL